MDDERIKQDRIKVLKAKVNYAETVRDNFKTLPPALQEMNSSYLATLNQELEDLEKSYIADRNQRKYSRIKVQRPVHLKFSSAQYEGVLDNISLGGFFVNGLFKQPKSNICKINLKESDKYFNHPIHAVGFISRTFSTGSAVVFLGMQMKDYKILETELLTHATIPSVLRDEISHQDIFEFDDNLVCNRSVNFNRGKLKKLLAQP